MSGDKDVEMEDNVHVDVIEPVPFEMVLIKEEEFELFETDTPCTSDQKKARNAMPEVKDVVFAGDIESVKHFCLDENVEDIIYENSHMTLTKSELICHRYKMLDSHPQNATVIPINAIDMIEISIGFGKVQAFQLGYVEKGRKFIDYFTVATKEQKEAWINAIRHACCNNNSSRAYHPCLYTSIGWFCCYYEKKNKNGCTRCHVFSTKIISNETNPMLLQNDEEVIVKKENLDIHLDTPCTSGQKIAEDINAVIIKQEDFDVPCPSGQEIARDINAVIIKQEDLDVPCPSGQEVAGDIDGAIVKKEKLGSTFDADEFPSSSSPQSKTTTDLPLS